jgi:predicted GTPase
MGRPRKNFVNSEEVAKPKRTYTKKVKVEVAEAPKAKAKYNWKKHVKPKTQSKEEILAKQVEELQQLLETSLENQMKTVKSAMEAEGKFVSLAKETEMSLNRMQYHCEQVQLSTGNLTLEDVNYCINLTARIIEHKFKKA